MKILDKIALVLFSCIILILSVVLCLLIFNWVDLNTVMSYLRMLLNNGTASNIALGVSVVCILLAVKGIFYTTDKNSDGGVENGILLQNENGKLLVSKDTIQNLVSGVVKGFENTQDVTSKVILGKENNVNIDVVLFVEQEAIIKDLSTKLQVAIKDVIKNSLDLEVKEVNIKVKNIAPKQEIMQG